MPLTTTSVTRCQSATKNPSQGVQKNRKPTSPQRSTQSRAVHPFSTSAIKFTLPEPLHEPSAAPQNQIDLPPRPGQKRRYISEDTGPHKRLREDLLSVSESGQPLSEENLDRHNRLTGSGTSDDMDPGAATPGRGRRERPLSRQSSIADIDQETASVLSQRSSGTAAHYRWVILKSMRVYIDNGPLPEEIQPRINAVIDREISDERKRELLRIAKKLCTDFIRVLSGASREDDCVEPIHHALSSMDTGGHFDFPRKADWEPSLKPSAPRKPFDMSYLGMSNDEAEDFTSRPEKRQHRDSAYASQSTSQSVMEPPRLPPPPNQDIVLVKTPRPDITAGLRHCAVVAAVKKRGPSRVNASDLLEYLQVQKILCSDLAQQASAIRFPFMVVEGKAYATGKTVFEAQNQASVSGSSMINLQHKLADLSESASPGYSDSKAPLAFSICTQGPYFELWVHYTISEDGIRMFYMNILQTCHTSLLPGVVEFLVMVDRVMSWASTDFVDDIAEQLAWMLKKAKQV